MSVPPATSGRPGSGGGAIVAHPQQDVTEVITVLRLTGLPCIAVVEDGVVLGTVTEQDLVQALAPDDAAIGDDVRRRLTRHRSLGRWVVRVCGGEVVLTGPDPDPVERTAVTAIAEPVTGVTAVRFAARGTDGPGRLCGMDQDSQVPRVS